MHLTIFLLDVPFTAIGLIVTGVISLIFYGIKAIADGSKDKRNMKKRLKQITEVYENHPTGTHGGHEYVELGLPSGNCWATSNVGADNPSMVGGYFQWGLSSPKVRSKSDYQTIKTPRLDSQQDTASVNWGSSWRMPTKEDFEELIEKCKWIEAKSGQIRGCKVVGPNGNSIFIPVTGYIYPSNKKPGNIFYRAYYWSSQQFEDENKYYFRAYFLSFNPSRQEIEIENEFKDHGLPVRPVLSASSLR